MDGRMAVARLPPLNGAKTIGMPPTKFDGLTGPSYKLGDTSHPLPNPRALRPYVDTMSGEVDTWPAHASGHAVGNVSMMLSKNKSLVIYNDEDFGKPQVIPKPRFLDQLETYLKKELRALGVTEVMPNELRLQAHREVFEYLIEDFKTYKPLLSAIKNEYEMMLAYQRQQIRDLEPLKQMLITVSEQCDQKIMSIRDEEKQEMTDLKMENKNLKERIQAMNNERGDLNSQVHKLQEELAAEYRRYRDECDARKMLIEDINEMRAAEIADESKQPTMSGEAVEDDPEMMKIALRQARIDEKNATTRLNDMVANYGDVIPRRDFEALTIKSQKMEEDYTTSKDDFAKLKAEHDALLEMHTKITKQRDEFYVELETMKRSSTPRPDWDKCADFVQGGMGRWKEISQNKSTNECVDVLLNEIAAGGGSDAGGAEYFDGKGTGPEIPAYLRVDGQVRNRRLGKRDCSLIIRDIWREKAANDAGKTDGVRDKMQDFLYEYLSRRFSMEQMRIEWGYNLEDACTRYAHDEMIGLFQGVLSGEIDEEVYHGTMEQIEQLMATYNKIDFDKGNPGKVTKDELRQGLKEVFPTIDPEMIVAIITAAEVELDARDKDEVEYQEMFKEDDEGRTGPFLDEVRKWIKQEKNNYAEDVKQQLSDLKTVSVDELKRGLSLADPEIDNKTMDKYVLWVFDTTPEKIAEVESIELSKVISRLQNGNVRRSGRKF